VVYGGIPGVVGWWYSPGGVRRGIGRVVYTREEGGGGGVPGWWKEEVTLRKEPPFSREFITRR